MSALDSGAHGYLLKRDSDEQLADAIGLELRLIVPQGDLRFYDPVSSRLLLSHAEAEQARREAEAEIERLRAELERLKGGTRQ